MDLPYNNNADNIDLESYIRKRNEPLYYCIVQTTSHFSGLYSAVGPVCVFVR